MSRPAYPLLVLAAVCVASSAPGASPEDGTQDAFGSADAAGASSGTEAPTPRADAAGASSSTGAPRAAAAGAPATPGLLPPSTGAERRRPSQRAEARREPSGTKGIGPYWEALRAGDVAHAQKDYRDAIEHFEHAIAIDPTSPAAHLRLGRALLSSNDSDRAEKAWREASRLASKEPKLKARALWMLADLRERLGKRNEAVDAYRVYVQFVTAHPDVGGSVKHAASRIERIERYQTLLQEYAAVGERIRKRAEEGAERLRDSSQ